MAQDKSSNYVQPLDVLSILLWLVFNHLFYQEYIIIPFERKRKERLKEKRGGYKALESREQKGIYGNLL